MGRNTLLVRKQGNKDGKSLDLEGYFFRGEKNTS